MNTRDCYALELRWEFLDRAKSQSSVDKSSDSISIRLLPLRCFDFPLPAEIGRSVLIFCSQHEHGLYASMGRRFNPLSCAGVHLQYTLCPLDSSDRKILVVLVLCL